MSDKSRRDFLRTTGEITGAAFGLNALSGFLKQEGLEESDIEPDFSDQFGDYSFIYGIHREPYSNYDSSEVSEDFDAVFLEHPGNYIDNPGQNLEILRNTPQYRDLFDRFEEYNIDVYLADVDMIEGTPLVEGGVLGSELAMGMKALKDMPLLPESSSYRDRIETTLAGGWLMNPILSYGTRIFSEMREEGDSLSGEILSNSERIHPETLLASRKFRNAVMTYKQKRLMENEDERRHYCTVIGSFHVGLEDYLTSDYEELYSFLETRKPYWEKFVDEPGTVSRATRFSYSDLSDEWHLIDQQNIEDLDNLI